MTSCCEPDPERLFSLFRDLVGIDSESGKEGRISSYLKDFASSLGLECHEDGAGKTTGGESGNLIIGVPEKGSFKDGPIMLNECVHDPSACVFGDDCPVQEIWCDAQSYCRIKIKTIKEILHTICQ